MSGLYHLRDLAYLPAVFEWRHELDLTKFPQLAEVQAERHPKRVCSLFGCPTLQRLWLRKYKSKNSDLREFAALMALESLELIQAPIRSLKGIEILRHLWELEIH